MRLHEKIKETKEPVVGLDYVQEYIAVSDPEMEPHYECELCGSKVTAWLLQLQNYNIELLDFPSHLKAECLKTLELSDVILLIC